MKAFWNDQLIADSSDTVVVEDNHYFPLSSVRADLLVPSDKSTWCPWKGAASYYSLAVNGQVNQDAAWFYADPKPQAEQIRGRVAFWRGVLVSE